MRKYFFVALLLNISAWAQVWQGEALVSAAREQIGVTVGYDGSYQVLAYPMGDVAQHTGVCTDVVVRALRKQGIDLQKLVHEDMRQHFAVYPKNWGLKKPDRNIDHRRVPNLKTYLRRHAQELAISSEKSAYQAGDIVTWRLPNHLPHIGIVSDKLAEDGTPLIIHNIGGGTKEENMLFLFEITGHYRSR